MKKIISILLTVTILFAICSVGIPAAAETTASTPQSGRIENELTATASDSFGSMLSEKLEEGQPTDEENANKILSVEVSGDVASVELETVTDAVVLVGVYDEEDDRMLASGTEHVTPDDTTAQVLLNAVAMPEYFVIRAFLVDEEENAPLCKSYESMLYTREMQEFLQKTTDDFAEESVLNLDDSEENNFAVYSDDTTLIESADDGTNTVAVADDESKTYVIENADESFTSLQPGEVFSYPYGDNGLLIVKIKTIAVDGTTVTITGDEIELDDVFDYVKLDNTMAVDEEQYDPSTCGDGVTFTGFDDIAATGSDGSKSDLAATGYDISVGKTSKLNFNIFKDDIEHSVELSAGLELELGVKLRIYITTAYQYLELKTEYSSKIYGKIEGTIKKDFPLGVIPIGPFWGVTLELKPAFAFEAKASVEFNLTFKGALGFSVSNTSGTQNLSESPKANFNTKLEGSIFVGLKVTSELNFLKEVAKAELSGTLGVEAEAELDRGDYNAQYSDVSGSAVSGVGDVTAKVAQPKEPDTIHDCQTCFKGQISAKLSLDTKATLLNLPLLTFNKNFLTVTRKLSDFHYSKDFNEFGFCQCLHKRNKISLSVFTEDKKAAGNATVTCSYIDRDNRSYQCLQTQTDAKGKLALMLSAGKYQLDFSRAGSKDLTKKIEVIDTKQDIKLTLKNASSSIIENEQCGENVYYTLSADGVLTIFGTGVIDDEIFSWRDDIKKVIIKKGITGIGDSAFAYCDSLTSVSIPDTVTSIGSSAFEECYSLKSITIPDSVTSIGSWAFCDCDSLTKVTIPDSITIIDGGLFGYCDSLRSVTLPVSATYIGEYAFCECTSLKSITLPDSAAYIGTEAFCECTSLTSVTIPENVFIDTMAFYGCTSLSNIMIPDSVTEIYNDAFKNTAWFANQPNGLVYAGKVAYKMKGNCPAAVTIKNGTVGIAAEAFAGCGSMTSVAIPDSVKLIGYGSFKNCSSLTNVTFPDNASIKSNAFNGCTSLSNIMIPDTVTDIGDGAFSNTAWYTNQPDGLVYAGKVAYKMKGSCPAAVRIKDGTVGIAAHAFDECTSLTSVTIPSGVTRIGDDAFWDCTSLTNVTIPDSVTYIEVGALLGTAWFENQPDGLVYAGKVAYRMKGDSPAAVTIKEGTVSISNWAFISCGSPTSVTIPDSVTSIGHLAFSNCISLSDIYYTGSEREWNAIEFGVIAIPSSAVIHYNSSGIASTGAAPVAVGAEPNITPVGEEPENDPFTRLNLVPGSEALLIVVSGEGRDAAPDSPDILYIAQTAADENGTARFNIDPALWGGEFSAAIFGQCAHVRCEWETFNEGTQDETQLYRCADCGRLMDTGGDDPHTALIGDADGDGSVTAADVTCIQRDRVGIMTGIDATAFLQGDVDKNGVVEIIDATYIQRYLAGMEIPYTIG